MLLKPDTITIKAIGDLYIIKISGNWDVSWGQGNGIVQLGMQILWDGVSGMY